MREIAEKVSLPPHLADHPYLTEYYGTVEWSVKAVYHGYLGWFRWISMELETLTSTDGPTPLCGCTTKYLMVTNDLMATMREDDDDKDYI